MVEHVGTVCQFGTPVRADKLIPLTNENALVDLSVSGSGTIYGSPCIINGTDHGLEWKIQSAVTESLSEYLYVSNLEPGLQEEGLEVSFEGAFRNDVDPFCHQGRVINTTLIEPVL
ncbi:MAG: hypothetical protein GWN61_11345 [candidate division Zixibacteria bacterium]|nr:hypothetical protein [candidate division Zixibacteria bacterium]NIR64796.1 hypothetical protein [candidate division Zixibacteria bacterium]NIS46624.1 hypothetical protein [candidate division Zixibacteria bacterium]NIU14266.1 hypothetical protein [candidate division Zixibacteria bacterium]NIV06746.1 hypothetical protein [candidate division Zixibacteria bacterium]